jgi:hypothetical protein
MGTKSHGLKTSSDCHGTAACEARLSLQQITAEVPMTNTTSKVRSIGFYAALVVGVALMLMAIGFAMKGLPGLQNSPTTTVDGKSVVGKTGN